MNHTRTPIDLSPFPSVSLTHLPTPLDPTPALSAALGIDLLIKRDDMTGLAFGGNKGRQLEFYLGDARARGADTVLITGAVQSNFVRMAAAGARRLGMDIHIQLEERVAKVDHAYRNSGNVLLDRLLGATLHDFPHGEDEAAADAALMALAATLADQGRVPYVIKLGASHPPVGALGYVNGALELNQQLRQTGTEADAVVVASGSGLTHAGLLVGMLADAPATEVHGICVRRGADLQAPRVKSRARELSCMLGSPVEVGESSIRVTDAVFENGYGCMGESTFEAIEMAARLEGLFLDPVYTAKSMAGLIFLVRDGKIPPGARVVYLHTGGTPALFGYETELTARYGPRA